jgi:hypothetical protein
MRAMLLLALLAAGLGLAVAAPAASAEPAPPEGGCEPLIHGTCVTPVTPFLCSVHDNPLCV